MRSIFSLIILATVLLSCQSEKYDSPENGFMVTLMTLDPGHFHSYLLQMNMYPEIDSVAYVYGINDDAVKSHLDRIEQYNTREDDPTHWVEKVYTGSDFVDKLFSEKPGNVLVVAGNNQKKTDYILRAVHDGINVYGDKPMAINGENFSKLKQAIDLADEKGVLVYDIMTQRYEITCILQKELGNFSSIFGEVVESSPEKPAMTQESVHYFSKIVSGNPLIRPAWFFDVEQQGSGIVDINTHLVDLIMWTLFPEENLQPSDAEITMARQWATELQPAQFKKVTGLDHYPDFLQKDIIKDSLLEVYSNGEIIFKLKDVYGKAYVSWDFEAEPGGQDTYYSIYRGTKSNIVLRSDETTDYKAELFVEPIGPYDQAEWSEKMKEVLESLQKDYPGVGFEAFESGFKLNIPDVFRISHEAHFSLVTKKYLDFLKSGSMPQWEKDFMLTKYYITTEAYEKSQAELEAMK